MRVAIVHDWLLGMRGGEHVLEALLELFPEAVIYTLFHERGKVSRTIENNKIVTSWLNRLPGSRRLHRYLLPLYPCAIQSLELGHYDLVISSSHSVAKGVRAGNAFHLSYCHTPARYLWDGEEDYRFGTLSTVALAAVRNRMRQWDCETSARVDHFVANSRFVAQRIRSYYGREAEIIYPPVDTHFFTPATSGSRCDFYLTVGALVPYKRFDIVIKAFNSLNRKLIVVGNGPEMRRLRSIAGTNIEMRGWVDPNELRHLYRTARALVFAGREDFGMIGIEARSCGCPVIAFGGGGLSEAVSDRIHGLLFEEQHEDDLIRNIQRFETMTWPVGQVRNGVETFSRESFKTRIRTTIENKIPKRHWGQLAGSQIA